MDENNKQIKDDFCSALGAKLDAYIKACEECDKSYKAVRSCGKGRNAYCVSCDKYWDGCSLYKNHQHNITVSRNKAEEIAGYMVAEGLWLFHELDAPITGISEYIRYRKAEAEKSGTLHGNKILKHFTDKL